MKLNPFWKVKLMKMENAPKEKEGRMIFICNHQSNMDPIAINSVFYYNTKWVSKDSIFNVPFGRLNFYINTLKRENLGEEWRRT